MTMRFAAAIVLIGLLLSAGCVRALPEVTPVVVSTRPTLEVSRPGPEPLQPRELLNRTYDYPVFGMGTHANETFLVPADYSVLEVRAEWLQDCPVYYGRNPRFVLQDPGRNETEIREDPGPNPPAATFICFYREPPATTNLTGASGEWRIWTAGEMRGSVQVTITARDSDLGG